MISDTLSDAVAEITEYQSGGYDNRQLEIEAAKTVMDALRLALDAMPTTGRANALVDGLFTAIRELDLANLVKARDQYTEWCGLLQDMQGIDPDAPDTPDTLSTEPSR